jgi:LPXTG-site transpeptidase (sortase) family protein
MIAVGGYMSVGSWRTDKIVKTEANALTNQANQTEVTNQVSASSSDGGVSDGTSNSGNTTLSDIKPTAAALANYVVAANLPRYLIIPKLNVDARVLSVGVNTNGDLGTPNDIYDTAWYNESAQPGQPGATLIDGHIAGYTSPGVFEKLKSLNPGDQIEVQIGNGTTFTYQVVKSQDYPANNVNMAEAMTPVTPGVSGLNLISCDGTIVPGKGQYTERIIVFAELVQ